MLPDSRRTSWGGLPSPSNCRYKGCRGEASTSQPPPPRQPWARAGVRGRTPQAKATQRPAAGGEGGRDDRLHGAHASKRPLHPQGWHAQRRQRQGPYQADSSPAQDPSQGRNQAWSGLVSRAVWCSVLLARGHPVSTQPGGQPLPGAPSDPSQQQPGQESRDQAPTPVCFSLGPRSKLASQTKATPLLARQPGQGLGPQGARRGVCGCLDLSARAHRGGPAPVKDRSLPMERGRSQGLAPASQRRGLTTGGPRRSPPPLGPGSRDRTMPSYAQGPALTSVTLGTPPPLCSWLAAPVHLRPSDRASQVPPWIHGNSSRCSAFSAPQQTQPGPLPASSAFAAEVPLLLTRSQGIRNMKKLRKREDGAFQKALQEFPPWHRGLRTLRRLQQHRFDPAQHSGEGSSVAAAKV